jgi:energy-coupling factor transporter ATP-binding protein EcfA2
MTTTNPGRPSGIRFTDRVFVAGVNGSGKSILINHLATLYRCQILLYDTKDEFTVPGANAVHSPERIDWNERIIHLIDDGGDLAETNRLFKTLWQRKVGRTGHAYGLLVVVHELGDLCADTPGGTPQWVSVYIRKGRAHGLGLLAGSQRPRNIPRVARTESQHIFSFAGGFDPEDVPVMAGMHRMGVPDFERGLAQAAKHGEHAYLWYDRRARTNVIRPPLPPEKLRITLAQGIDPSQHRTPEPEELRSAPESSGEIPENSGKTV